MVEHMTSSQIGIVAALQAEAEDMRRQARIQADKWQQVRTL